MTAKTGKNEVVDADGVDEVDEVEAVPAETETEETEETETRERPARPAAKRKRRVRVIEVIDDEDLDEVLEALDAEDAEAEQAEQAREDEAEDEEERPARPAKKAKPAAKPAAKAPAKPAAKAAAKPTAEPSAKAKPRPTRLEPPEEAEDEQEGEAPEKVSVGESAAARSADDAAPPRIFGLSVVQATVVVVLVALLATAAVWQWRSASGMSSEQDERDAVSGVASAYGDVALNYNAQNYQSQMEEAQQLMGGDLLESFKNTTLPQLGETFKNNPEVALSSKTNQVFVGSVDDRFATAVVMVDVNVKTKDGSSAAPATLLRLALAKIDGEWKVTKQYASGANDQNQNQNQLPAAPTGGASKSPSTQESEKPGD